MERFAKLRLSLMQIKDSIQILQKSRPVKRFNVFSVLMTTKSARCAVQRWNILLTLETASNQKRYLMRRESTSRTTKSSTVKTRNARSAKTTTKSAQNVVKDMKFQRTPVN